jgi:hypothetical protein
MKILIPCVAAAFILSACATTDEAPGSGGTPSSKSAKEDYVTGSRIPRSESNENYQGSKTITGKEYQDYKASTGLRGQ